MGSGLTDYEKPINGKWLERSDKFLKTYDLRIIMLASNILGFRGEPRTVKRQLQYAKTLSCCAFQHCHPHISERQSNVRASNLHEDQCETSNTSSGCMLLRNEFVSLWVLTKQGRGSRQHSWLDKRWAHTGSISHRQPHPLTWCIEVGEMSCRRLCYRVKNTTLTTCSVFCFLHASLGQQRTIVQKPDLPALHRQPASTLHAFALEMQQIRKGSNKRISCHAHRPRILDTCDLRFM